MTVVKQKLYNEMFRQQNQVERRRKRGKYEWASKHMMLASFLTSSNGLMIIKTGRSLLLWSSLWSFISNHCLNTGRTGIIPRGVRYHYRHKEVSFVPTVSLHSWHQRSSPPWKCPKNTGTSWNIYFTSFASIFPGCRITLSCLRCYYLRVAPIPHNAGCRLCSRLMRDPSPTVSPLRHRWWLLYCTLTLPSLFL